MQKSISIVNFVNITLKTKKEMANQNNAQEWVESRCWANGWNVEADATINAEEFASQYEKNQELWDKLFKFLAETDLKTLEAGKIVLVPDRLWINVLEYTPKSAEDTKVESHKNMIDLQYTFEGNELMGLTDKVVVTEEYNPVKDVTKYRADGEVSYVPAGPDRFFLYFPSDMHQPSVQAPGEVVPSRKIVGKIEYAK